jgi:hypothetical protein
MSVPSERPAVATATMLAEAIGADRQSTTSALHKPFAPPGTHVGPGPVYWEDDGLRYLEHRRQGQKLVPPEQYELARHEIVPWLTREQLADVDERRLPVHKLAALLAPDVRGRLLEELRRPWRPAPPGPGDPDGYLTSGTAARLAGLSATQANIRLGDEELLARHQIGFVMIGDIRLFYPTAHVLGLLARRKPPGGTWARSRTRYTPPADSPRRRRRPAGRAAAAR